jgi:beta-glucanase (GH16 family)
MNLRTLPCAVLLTVAVPLASAVSVAQGAQAATGPLRWSGRQWCPNFAEQQLNQCNAVQHNKQHANVWNPTRVSIDRSGDIVLQALGRKYALDGVTYPYQSGAINTDPLKRFSPGTAITARIDLPCNASGKIYNWPGFIVTGANVAGNPPWPASGEIDVLEGLGGRAAWHYHYKNASGGEGSYGAAAPGSFCGWHVFGVVRTASTLGFWYDGKLVGCVTHHVVDYPMFVRLGYGIGNGTKGSPGGPVNPRAALKAAWISIRSDAAKCK